MEKVKRKTTGEVCNVDQIYTNPVDHKATIYLKDHDGRLLALPLAKFMKEYDSISETNDDAISHPYDENWEPRPGRTYYVFCINHESHVVVKECVLPISGNTQTLYANKPYPTRDLARKAGEKALAKAKAYRVLLKDTKGFKPDWKDTNTPKFSVVYCHGYHDKLMVDSVFALNAGVIYFSSIKDAEASIKAHPNEWQTYLGVEE